MLKVCNFLWTDRSYIVYQDKDSINHRTFSPADVLAEKLCVAKFANSRSKHSNDDVLMKLKNGVVVHKKTSRLYPFNGLLKRGRLLYSVLISFACTFNFYRPCFFQEPLLAIRWNTGNMVIAHDDILEKLKSSPHVALHFRPGITGITFEQLNANILKSQEQWCSRKHDGDYSNPLSFIQAECLMMQW